MVFHKIYNGGRVFLIACQVSVLLLFLGLVPSRQVACFLKGADALVGGNINRIMIGVEGCDVVTTGCIAVVVDSLKDTGTVHQS